MLRRLEFRIINPELLPVAHRDAGGIALHLTPEFVRRLKPEFARTGDRLVEHVNGFFFLEVSLDLRRGGAFLANAREQSFYVGGRKRIGRGEGSEKEKRDG